MAFINRSRDPKGLSRKEEKALRGENDEMRAAVQAAAEILREVQMADRVLPQLPIDVRTQVDTFLEIHRPQPTLPQQPKKKLR